MGGELLQDLEALVRVDDLDELDLVELVHADDALVVAPGGPGLAAEARGVGDHSDRQIAFG